MKYRAKECLALERRKLYSNAIARGVRDVPCTHTHQFEGTVQCLVECLPQNQFLCQLNQRIRGMHTSNALRTWIVYVGFSPIIMIRAAYSSFGMVCVHVLSARTEDALNLILRQGYTAWKLAPHSSAPHSTLIRQVNKNIL